MGSDLRHPECDETPLSVHEVWHGWRDGTIGGLRAWRVLMLHTSALAMTRGAALQPGAGARSRVASSSGSEVSQGVE